MMLETVNVANRIYDLAGSNFILHWSLRCVDMCKQFKCLQANTKAVPFMWVNSQALQMLVQLALIRQSFIGHGK